MQNTPNVKSICINCMLKSRLNQYPEDAPEDMKVEYMLKVLGELASMKTQQDPTIATRRILDLQKEMFGSTMDYKTLKKRFNHFVMEKEGFLREQIQKAKDPLKLAIQYSIVGNLIDFIVMDSVDEKRLEKMFSEASGYVLDERVYQALRLEICTAKNIVYLTDNCGEIAVDKLVIQLLKTLNPKAEITAVVRGGEILNDATMEDAIQVGLLDVVEVIGNGSDMPGTCLQFLSKEAKELIDSSDVILSKGQGNLETLQGCGLNVYYIFLCKCEMVAEMFGVPKFTPMLVSEK